MVNECPIFCAFIKRLQIVQRVFEDRVNKVLRGLSIVLEKVLRGLSIVFEKVLRGLSIVFAIVSSKTTKPNPGKTQDSPLTLLQVGSFCFAKA